MRLKSTDSAEVSLRPIRYQFPKIPPSSEDEWDWDANWLVIRGEARLSDGRGWWFEVACLTTREPRISVHGSLPSPSEAHGSDRFLAFTEPNIGFACDGTDGSIARIRVHFSLESTPPWEDRYSTPLHDFHVALSIPIDEVSQAAGEWTEELTPFPVR